MATTGKAPEAGWARLHPKILHDGAWLDGSAHARLLFLTSIAEAKATNQDGRVEIRSIIGTMWGAMTPEEVGAAAEELYDSGLWTRTASAGVAVVTRFARWNETVAEQADAKARKRIGALRTNHRKGQHRPSPVDDCPDCQQPATDLTPPPTTPTEESQGQDRSAIAGATASARRDGDETRRDETPPTPPAELDPADAYVVDVADQLVTIVGSLDAANQAVRWFTAKALANGWSWDDDLEDLGWDTAGRDLEDPIAYLIGGLRRRARERGPGVPSSTTSRDERAPTEAELLAEYYSRFPDEAPAA